MSLIYFKYFVKVVNSFINMKVICVKDNKIDEPSSILIFLLYAAYHSENQNFRQFLVPCKI